MTVMTPADIERLSTPHPTTGIYFDVYEHRIAKHWLSALVNGDESGLADAESLQLARWLDGLHAGTVGHWAASDGDDFDFARCEVCGLMADTTVVYWLVRRHA